MNEAYSTYEESSAFEEYTDELQSFPISRSDKSILITINTTESKLRRFVNYFQKKEEFYIKALNGLLIQNNFLDLALQLEEGYITEEAYNNEIDNNSEKYVVNTDILDNPNDIFIIKDIVKKLGVDLTIEEIAELFSLNEEDLENKILERA
jgi:hypothetical protein